MPKNKLRKFAEYESFTNTYDARNQLKGKWNVEVFGNNNPITLELACGRGEYTVGLAQLYPDRNFVGIDVKASRMWQGAKFALENKLPNVAFIRIQIDFLDQYYVISGQVTALLRYNNRITVGLAYSTLPDIGLVILGYKAGNFTVQYANRLTFHPPSNFYLGSGSQHNISLTYIFKRKPGNTTNAAPPFIMR